MRMGASCYDRDYCSGRVGKTRGECCGKLLVVFDQHLCLLCSFCSWGLRDATGGGAVHSTGQQACWLRCYRGFILSGPISRDLFCRQHCHRRRVPRQLERRSGLDFYPQQRGLEPARREAYRHRRSRCSSVARLLRRPLRRWQHRHGWRSIRLPRSGVDFYPQRRRMEPGGRKTGW